MRDLATWLTYLETLHFKTIDLGLERVTQVARQLNLIPFNIFAITVAGTNGKGSCVALTESILLAAGYRVGTYTSPHLLNYNERVHVNGEVVTDEMLCRAFAEIEKIRGDISLTYFEFGTLAALLLFKQANLDVVVLEVGMGGRLDAVNVIDADISVISTIALDHVEWLGDNREAIGFEKAGIMRANKPCVCGDFDVPQSILKYAKELGALLYCQNKDFGYEQRESEWSWWGKQQKIDALPIPKIDLQNAATILQVIELLPEKSKQLIGWAKCIETGLKQVFIPGRFQIISKDITTILDVAHNPASAELLAKNLQKMSCSGRTLAVVGMLGDKDISATVKNLLNEVNAWYVADLHVPRGGTAELLANSLHALNVTQVSEYVTVTAAYQQVLTEVKPGDRIVVFGSFYTVAEVMQLGL